MKRKGTIALLAVPPPDLQGVSVSTHLGGQTPRVLSSDQEVHSKASRQGPGKLWETELQPLDAESLVGETKFTTRQTTLKSPRETLWRGGE